MVIVVFIEGGIVDNKADVSTICNSEALREELNKFFQRALNRDDIEITVKKCAGYKNAASEFIRRSGEVTAYLYADLDMLPERRDEWFLKLSNEGHVISAHDRSRVFFWIQEMEAWFLKQPDCIEHFADDEGWVSTPGKVSPLSDHSSIKGKDIERLQHKPSFIVKTILAQSFVSAPKRSQNKPNKIKYGKLKHAPGMISHLNPLELVEQDNELRDFITSVSLQDESSESFY